MGSNAGNDNKVDVRVAVNVGARLITTRNCPFISPVYTRLVCPTTGPSLHLASFR